MGIESLQISLEKFYLKLIIRIVFRACNYYEHLMRDVRRCLRTFVVHKKYFTLITKFFVTIRYADKLIATEKLSHDERIALEVSCLQDLRSFELNTYKINALPNFFRSSQATGKIVLPS